MQQTPLDELWNRIEACKLFERERVPNELKARAVLAYFRGMSFRSVAAQFDHRFSAESVRRWWHKLRALYKEPSGRHDIIAVDETSLHLGRRSRKVIVKRWKGKWNHPRPRRENRRIPATHLLWAGINVRTFEVVNVLLGKHTTSDDCYRFLSEVKRRSGTAPHIVHDRGAWYRRQCETLNLSHEQMRGGVRSHIESWNRHLKHRLDRFWRAFPPNSSNTTMQNWLLAFCVCWNATRKRVS